MAIQPQIAVILSTYQRPAHLHRSLLSLALQQGVEGQFEVVVTDDGSSDETEEVVRRFATQVSLPVSFTTHPHRRYHVSRCRNEGVLASSAPYLLFADSDCVFPPDHLSQHLRIRRQGIVWSGDCVRLDAESTSRIDDDAIASGTYLAEITPSARWQLQRRQIKDWFYQLIRHPHKPKLIGCNIALWRTDFERVNGFDENFTGWGCEDDDLSDRLRATGLRIASSMRLTRRVVHLWHPPHTSQPRQWSDGLNVRYLLRENKPTRCVIGLSGGSREDTRVQRFNVATPTTSVDDLAA